MRTAQRGLPRLTTAVDMHAAGCTGARQLATGVGVDSRAWSGGDGEGAVHEPDEATTTMLAGGGVLPWWWRGFPRLRQWQSVRGA